jgi:hypothetical protein
MDSEQLRYQLGATERVVERLRHDEKADPKVIAAYETLASAIRQKLEVASQPIARDRDSESPDY